MGVNVKVDNSKRNKKTIYPYLGIHPTGAIVYFTKKKSGVCIVPGSCDEPVGQYSTQWHEHAFTYFDGTVTLDNQL